VQSEISVIGQECDQTLVQYDINMIEHKCVRRREAVRHLSKRTRVQ